MSEEEQYERILYQRMRRAAYGKSNVDRMPIELLMEWEKTRLRLNPKAKPQDLTKFESVEYDRGWS